MTERPILFSAPMVRAILDGSKTQTRRVFQPQPKVLKNGTWYTPYLSEPAKWCYLHGGHQIWWAKCPYAAREDHLWVREAWSGPHSQRDLKPREMAGPFWYWADGNPDGGDWTKPKPSIHMPRHASRITLEVTEVRVERLQSISEADAQAEGAIRMVMDDEMKFYDSETGTFKCGFAGIWAHINGADSWEANPWVWAISFRRVKP